MAKNPQIRLRKLHYRSWHRGCKETDVILGRFADTHLEALSAAQLEVYERFLDEQDSDIWNWLVDKEEPSRKEYVPLIRLLRQFSGKLFEIAATPSTTG